MKYKLVFTASYNRRARRFFKGHPELLSQYGKTLKILEVDPNHPALRLHRLEGHLSSLYSVSINLSYRITLEFYISEKEIVLVNVGSHQDVYR